MFVSKAKMQTDIKIKAAKLIWPGGMSGAPESAAASRPSIRRSGRAEWRVKQFSNPHFLFLLAARGVHRGLPLASPITRYFSTKIALSGATCVFSRGQEVSRSWSGRLPRDAHFLVNISEIALRQAPGPYFVDENREFSVFAVNICIIRPARALHNPR